MNRHRRIGYEQVRQLDLFIETLACPNCKEPIQETRTDPRDAEREQPYCCGLLWIPYLYIQIGRPITVKFKHFDPAIDPHRPPWPSEITCQTPVETESEAEAGTAAVNPADESQVDFLAGSRPETTDEETTDAAGKTVYDLIGEFIDSHIEFTTPEVRVYVVARRPTGKISKQGLNNALEQHISDGNLMRLKRALYRRLR